MTKFRMVCNTRNGVTSRVITTSATSSRSSGTSRRNGNADTGEKGDATGKGETAGKGAVKGESAEGEEEVGGERRPLRLVVIGGGAAGVFAAIRAKEMAPSLEVRVVEKSQPLGKTEPDGRMFPVSDSSQSVIDCLLSQAHELSVTISPGWPVASITHTPAGQFLIFSSKKTPTFINSSSSPSSSSPSSSPPSSSPLSLMADFVLIATASSFALFKVLPLLYFPHHPLSPLFTSLFTPPHLFPPISTPGAFHFIIPPSLHHPSPPFPPSSSKSDSVSPHLTPSHLSPSLITRSHLLPPFYPSQGHDMAASLGYSIIPPCPSLLTFNIPDSALTA
ncbi:unnamed protein product [Closterium sp. Yama58-4]|nr:unnamed protein product [Closterium sp. Yama58-4]